MYFTFKIYKNFILYYSGVFLVPYFIILFVCGVPMLFMELAVGQYTGRGPIGAIGQLCPLLKGIFGNKGSQLKFQYSIFLFYLFIANAYGLGVGMASVVVSFLMSTYYSVIIAYAIYYFFAAFRPEIPWLDCSHRFVN